jgi:DNA helicase-2/ATP-dependent DNA helicase PcrA
MDTANCTLDRPKAFTRITQTVEALRNTRESDDQQLRMGLLCQPANLSEEEERAFLALMTRNIGRALKTMHQSVVSRHEEMIEIKQQIQEHARDLDHVDKANLRQAADMASRVGEHAVEQRRKLSRLLESPYFGRIDVDAVQAHPATPVYIGVHAFADPQSQEPLIHDWRAPISSMFYDFELGEAYYDAPEGRVAREISLKRQYRIEKQQFRFMLESSLNIQDDILQEELSRAADDKLKTIVATIQRDQNAIIRNEHAQTLVIQGAAGSGKTSIALHRVAYLLYKHKDTIRSDDILIVSPNKVFAHYISQVLPELGEEMIRETTMEQLANELLDGEYKFQTFAEQVSKLLEGGDEAFAQRVRFKALADFLDLLDRYIDHVHATNLRVDGIRIGMIRLDSNWIGNQFGRRAQFSVSEQVNGVVTAIVEHMKYQHQKAVVGKERTRIRNELRKMFAETNLKTIYRNFFTWAERPDMFKQGPKGALEYADVFPLVYLKMMLEGTNPRHEIKHVVIDEMQDYTAVQYRVISTLYPSKMTILGDRNQAVNPLSSSNAESIRDVLPDAECVYMQKSYRSTVEITNVAQSIVHNPDLIPIERHGEPPRVMRFPAKAREIGFLIERARAFADSGYHSMGIICKTQKQAEALYDHLRGEVDVRLIDADSKIFSGGILIATAYLAKGLEFDEIMVPFCNENEYNTQTELRWLPFKQARWVHDAAGRLQDLRLPYSARLVRDQFDHHVVLLHSTWDADYLQRENPKFEFSSMRTRRVPPSTSALACQPEFLGERGGVSPTVPPSSTTLAGQRESAG